MAISSAPGLYLDIAEAAGAPERLEAAMSTLPPRAVLIRPASGKPFRPETTRPLIALAQRNGAAALLCGDFDAARALGADGVHLPYSADYLDHYKSARAKLGASAIVGVDAGVLRHDAMVLGESGADYVAFACSPGDDSRQQQLDLIEWWAEIFEVPCVALDVADIAHAARLALAGADFIGWRIPNGLAPADISEGLKALQSEITQHQVARTTSSSGAAAFKR